MIKLKEKPPFAQVIGEAETSDGILVLKKKKKKKKWNGYLKTWKEGVFC